MGRDVKDPYQQMMEDVMAIGLFVMCLAIAFFTQGCVNTKVDKLVDISMDKSPAQSCPKLVMPPVPNDVVLDIRGDKVISNEGGDTILRGYVRARQLLQ